LRSLNALARTLCLAALAAPIGAAFAQSTPASSPRTVAVRADNDAFDFWMPPWNRPDEEYTSGVRVTYDGGDSPLWSRRWIGRGLAACTIGATVCRTGRSELGQDIYTPSVSVDDPHATAGSRPNAGWLFVSQTARILRDDRSDDFTVTLGVTGPPSLGRQMQHLAHSVAPEFNRPTDWSRQIAFEPGIIVRYEQQRRVTLVGDETIGMDLIPRAAIDLGNIASNAELGVGTRIGWHLAHPWLPDAARPEIALSGGAWGRGVARDIFVDGNTFRDGPSVGHRPFVAGGDVGLDLRYGPVSVGYRVTAESRAYDRAPMWHPWASIVGAVTFDR